MNIKLFYALELEEIPAVEKASQFGCSDNKTALNVKLEDQAEKHWWVRSLCGSQATTWGAAEVVENVAPVAPFRPKPVYIIDTNGVGEAEVRTKWVDAGDGVEQRKLARQASPIDGKAGGAVRVREAGPAPLSATQQACIGV